MCAIATAGARELDRYRRLTEEIRKKVRLEIEAGRTTLSLPLRSRHGAEDFGIPPGRGQKREFHLRRRSSLIRTIHVKFSANERARTSKRVATRISESPGAPSPWGRERRARRLHPGIAFFSCSQPSRAVPFSSFHRHIGHDFSKRLTSSQCVICLSSDTKAERETREHVRAAPYINVHYTGASTLSSHFLSADFLSASGSTSPWQKRRTDGARRSCERLKVNSFSAIKQDAKQTISLLRFFKVVVSRKAFRANFMKCPCPCTCAVKCWLTAGYWEIRHLTIQSLQIQFNLDAFAIEFVDLSKKDRPRIAKGSLKKKLTC